MILIIVLINIILTITLPIGSFMVNVLLFSFSKNKNRRRIYALTIAFTLGLVAYNFIPNESMDLYRIFDRMSWMSYTDFSAFLNIFITDIEIGFNFVIYLISKTGDFHIAPFLFTTLGYFLILLIINSYTLKKEISSMLTLFIVMTFFLSFPFVLLVSGIRNFIAIIIFVYILYLEKVENKIDKFKKLVYLIPILFHISMIIFVILKILAELKMKSNGIYIMVTTAIISFLSPFVIIMILSLFDNNALISDLLGRIISYTSNDYDFYSFYILLAMFFQFTIYLYIGRKNYLNDKTNFISKYFLYIVILGLGVCRYFVIFDRVIYLLCSLFVIVVIDYLSKYKNMNRENKFVIVSIVITSSILIFRNQIVLFGPYLIEAINNL